MARTSCSSRTRSAGRRACSSGGAGFWAPAAVRSRVVVHRRGQRARRVLRIDRARFARARRAAVGAAVPRRHRRRHGRGAAARAFGHRGRAPRRRRRRIARRAAGAAVGACVRRRRRSGDRHRRVRSFARAGDRAERARARCDRARSRIRRRLVRCAACRGAALGAFARDVVVQERRAFRAAVREPARPRGGDPARVLADRFDVDGYLARQGDLFVERFDANSYRTLTRAMDLFDLRGHERPAGSTQLTFVGIEDDQLYPPRFVRACADALGGRGLGRGVPASRERSRPRRVPRGACILGRAAAVTIVAHPSTGSGDTGHPNGLFGQSPRRWLHCFGGELRH